LHWPTNAGEAPATTRPAGHGVAAAYGPRIFVAGDPSASGRAPLAFVAPTFRACPEHGEWVGIFRAAWRGPSLFDVCNVPKLFVAAGFSRAGQERTAALKGASTKTIPGSVPFYKPTGVSRQQA